MDTIQRQSRDANWRDGIELEHDNLRAALAWSQAAPAGSITSLQLGNALAPFWKTRGYYHEQSLALFRAAGAKYGIASVLKSLANLDYFVGNRAKAREQLGEQAFDQTWTEGRAVVGAGGCGRLIGHPK